MKSSRALEVRTLRHQVGSHSVDYRDPNTSLVSAHVPVRIGLTGFSCMTTEGRGNATRTVELDKAVHEHCRVLVSVLDRVFEKSISTIFRGNDKKIEEFTAKLSELREIAAGDLIVRGIALDGSKNSCSVGWRAWRITRRWSGPRRRYTSFAVGRRVCAAAAAQRPYVRRHQKWQSISRITGRYYFQSAPVSLLWWSSARTSRNLY